MRAEGQLAGGDRLAGRYRLRELIGAGDIGLVWRATDELLHRTVAVKRIGTAGGDAAAVARARHLLNEARIATRLDHPRLLRVLDVVVHEGMPWLVLQHVEARSWASLCQEHAPLAPRAAVHEAVGGSPVVAGVPPAPAAGPLTGVLARCLCPDPGQRLDAPTARALFELVAEGG